MQSNCKNEECPITLDVISTLSPKNIVIGSDGVCYNKDALKIHFTTSIKNREKRIGDSISNEDTLRYPNGQPVSLKDISDIGLNYKKLIRRYYDTKVKLDRAMRDASVDIADNMYRRVYNMLIKFGLDYHAAIEYAESDQFNVYHHAIEEGDFTTEYEDILFNYTRDDFISMVCNQMQTRVYYTGLRMRLDENNSRIIARDASEELEALMRNNNKLTDEDETKIFEGAIKKMEKILNPPAKERSLWSWVSGRGRPGLRKSRRVAPKRRSTKIRATKRRH